MRCCKLFLISFMFSSLISLILCLDEQAMLYTKYQGQWQMIGGQKIRAGSPFSKFSVNEGIALIYFTDLGRKSKQIEGVIVQILAPQYYDQLMIKLIMELSQNDKRDQFEWQGNQQIKFQLYDQTYKIQQEQRNYYFYIDSETISINSQSENLTIIIPYYQLPIAPQVTLVFSIFSLSIFLIVKRKSTIQQENTIRHQVTPIILAFTLQFIISIVELIIGCNSLFAQMNPEAFFVICGFLNLTACYHIVRFYYSIILQKKKLIILSWVLVILYVWLLLYFRHNPIFLILNSLIFMPQIIYHAFRGQKIKMDFRYIFFCLSNQVCPQNILRQSPNYIVGYCLAGILAFQVFLLIGQIYLSPRFFIPWFLLPKQYNYYNQKQIQKSYNLKTTNQCYICLEQILQTKKNKISLMITPCKHLFHSDCLKEWMSVKMQCPIDRSTLPAL